MIAFVRGRVEAVEGDTVIIDIGSIAFEVLAPLAMLNPRPVVGEEILLHTHLHVREDNWLLFGFSDKEQLHSFRLLQTVSGIGAKTALAIVDRVSPQRLAVAIANKDSSVFTAVSGVGKKTAERLLLELKDKFPAFVSEEGIIEPLPREDALDPGLLAALKQLGYTATEARAYTMKAMAALGEDAETQDLLKEALKLAMKG